MLQHLPPQTMIAIKKWGYLFFLIPMAAPVASYTLWRKVMNPRVRAYYQHELHHLN